MVEDKRTGFLFDKNNHHDLSEKIIEFFDSNNDFKNNIIQFREQFSWEYFIKGILDFHESL